MMLSIALGIVFLASQLGPVHSRLLGIPTVPFNSTGRGSFNLSSVSSIVVDSKFANTTDTNGETLIPPTLLEFATTFANDLSTSVLHDIPITVGGNASSSSIFLTVGQPTDYLDAAGRPTSEGYSLNVSSSGVTITGASPLGSWWGTRSVLQQVVLGNGSIPFGFGIDSPGWGIRGGMLDAGRHFYPPDFIMEMCSYFSFFKQNTFHLHMSDNLYNNVDIYSREQSLNLYARFRPLSNSTAVAGLNVHPNESYTREQFDDIQYACAARGVTILPELEAPGHALVITQWKPELGLPDLSLLNISVPETIPTMETVWGTFIDWFHSKTVHIGADEYTGLASDYTRFVNAMASYIGGLGKSIRIWGTFPPNNASTTVYGNISVQHWEFFDDNPYFDFIKKNYSVLNSDDAFYVVNKFSPSYPQQINLTTVFHGNPAGGPWYPYIFDTKNTTNNPLRSNPLVLGEIAALWNDYGPSTSVYLEAYYTWRDGLPALADKQWGGDLTETEYYTILPILHPTIPDQNLDRTVESKTTTIMKYDFTSPVSGRVVDLSGNSYDGITTCSSNQGLAIAPNCSLLTPLTSKGRNYTLNLSLQISTITQTPATVLSGSDSSLVLTPNITLYASGVFFGLNLTLPLGETVELSIIARGNQTFAKVGNQTEMFKSVFSYNGEYDVYDTIAVEAPVHEIGGAEGGWTGTVKSMELSSVA